MKNTLNTLITALALGISVFIISIFFQGKVSAQSSLTVESTDTAFPAGEISDPFLAELGRISSFEVNLNDKLFQNPAFKSLKDFSREIPEESRGRDNPFAPIGI